MYTTFIVIKKPCFALSRKKTESMSDKPINLHKTEYDRVKSKRVLSGIGSYISLEAIEKSSRINSVKNLVTALDERL